MARERLSSGVRRPVMPRGDDANEGQNSPEQPIIGDTVAVLHRRHEPRPLLGRPRDRAANSPSSSTKFPGRACNRRPLCGEHRQTDSAAARSKLSVPAAQRRPASCNKSILKLLTPDGTRMLGVRLSAQPNTVYGAVGRLQRGGWSVATRILRVALAGAHAIGGRLGRSHSR